MASLYPLLATLVVVARIELAVRRLHLADYPLFRRDPATGYEPRANCSGLMRRRFRWAFNAAGLRMDHDRPADAGSVLLVGDSIVEPGAHVDQADTLGARLEVLCGATVHPAGSGGWALGNELAFIAARPQLLEAGTVVWLINSGDLVATNQWDNGISHPLKAPWLHSAFLALRFAERLRARIARRLLGPMVERTDGDWRAGLTALLPRMAGKRVLWVLYPQRDEVASGTRPLAELHPLLAGSGRVVEVIAAAGWTADCYADGIHPNAAGRDRLARIIADALATG